MRAFDAALGCRPGNECGHTLRTGSAEHTQQAEWDEFRCADHAAKGGCRGAFFWGCVGSTGAFARFPGPGADCGTCRQPRTYCTGADQRTKRPNAFGQAATNAFFQTDIRQQAALRRVARAANEFPCRVLDAFRQQGGCTECGRLQHTSGTAQQALRDFPEIVQDALTLIAELLTEALLVRLHELVLLLAQDGVNALLLGYRGRVPGNDEPIWPPADVARYGNFGHVGYSDTSKAAACVVAGPIPYPIAAMIASA